MALNQDIKNNCPILILKIIKKQYIFYYYNHLPNIQPILHNEFYHILCTHRVITCKTNRSQIVYFVGPAQVFYLGIFTEIR